MENDEFATRRRALESPSPFLNHSNGLYGLGLGLEFPLHNRFVLVDSEVLRNQKGNREESHPDMTPS
jgi:hypothetical protein